MSSIVNMEIRVAAINKYLTATPIKSNHFISSASMAAPAVDKWLSSKYILEESFTEKQFLSSQNAS